MTSSSSSASPPALVRRVTVLASYYYLRKSKAFVKLLAALAPYMDVMIDSGAFSAYSSSRKRAAKGLDAEVLTVEEYCTWLREYGPLWWQYVALDEIRNPHVTRRNLEQMVALGTRPMPVFVYPESYDYVRELLTVNDHICCAALVDSARDFAIQRVQRVYEASEQRARIHGLGFVKWPYFMQLPLNSVDASSFTRGARFGMIDRCFHDFRIPSTPWSEYVRTRDPAMTAYLRDECGAPPRVMTSPAVFKGQGLAHLVTTFAHLSLSHRVAARGRRYFLALNQGNLLNICAVLATMRTTRHDGLAFDYVESDRVNRHLKGLSKADLDACMRECIDIVQRRTAWQEKLP